jgi:hypothetical protein
MMRMRQWLFLIVALVSTTATLADEFRPALLEITETEPGRYAVLWKVPLQNGRVLDMAPVFPQGMKQRGPASARTVQGSRLEQSTWVSETDSFVGSTIEIAGLSVLPIDVIVQIDTADGSEHSAILRPATPSYVVPDRATKWTVAASYWKIGTIHILEGYDHLLFVLALLLIIPNLWMLFKTITAFTLAHSVSLALATLGIVNMPGAPTEAVISLSILFLAVEIVHARQGRKTFTEQYPWVVALAFGLVHGLGFAGALAEVGLPQNEIPLALLMFNVGVETGQILFVCGVLLVMAVLKRIPVGMPAGSWRLVPYFIGCTAAFWTVQRVSSFV